MPPTPADSRPDAPATLDTPPLTPTPPGSHAAPSRVGRFDVRRFLGEGGFGRVYEAHDTLLDRLVALKVAKPERFADPASEDRFVAEARAAANLRHPNIVAVFDGGRYGPNLFIASAYIPGRTLEELLHERQDGRPLREAVRTARLLADALAYSHSKGVIHRDVKPGNVLLDEAGEPLLADFGLARRAGEDSPEGHAPGTPAYMAPEQWQGKASAASDQYSLGCVLYQMLTGRRPFDAGSGGQYRFLHEAEPPAAPRGLRREVSRDLEAVCLKCLEKEPARRYAGCRELADDLRRVEDGLPVAARRPGLAERASRWVRRNPAAAALIATLALLIAALGLAGDAALRAANENVKRLEAEKRVDDEKRERQQDSLQAALRRALQRGAGKEALELAERADLRLTPEIRLDRARALSIMSRRVEAVRELRSFDRKTLPADLTGSADLLEGSLLLGTKENEKALQLIRGALTQNLPRDDKLFAEGLLEKTVPASLRKCQAAIEVNPGHVEARVMATLCLITLGRLDEAIFLGEQSQPLAPRHSHFPLLLALAVALKDDQASANKHLATLRSLGATKSQLSLLNNSLRLLRNGRREMHAMLTARRSTSGLGMNDILGLIAFRFTTDPELGLPATPAISDALRFFVDEFVGSSLRSPDTNFLTKLAFRTAVPGAETRSVFGKDDPAGLDRAREKLRDYPEGSVRYLFALQLQGRALAGYLKDMASQDHRARLAEAAQEYENAARAPGLFGLEAAALHWAAMLFTTAGMAKYGNPGTPAWCEKGRDLMRERMSLRPPLEGDGDFQGAANVALHARDYPFALVVLDGWKRAHPSSLDSRYYLARAKAYANLGAKERAGEMLDKITPAELKVPATREMVEEVRKMIREAPPPAPTP